MINPRYLLLFVSLFSSTSSQANLIFSEYIEGSSYNKALELFNSGGAVDFDAGNYNIEIYSNGGNSSSYVIPLSGILPPNSTFVIGHSRASVAISSMANLLVSSLNFNGDDAIRLVANGETLDSIGQVGTDPGSEWGSGLLSTQNNTLRRHAQIVTGDSNTSDVFVPSLEWLGFDVDIFSGLGNHEFEPVLQQPPRVEEPRVSAPEPSSVMLLIIGLLFLQLKRSNINQFMSFRGENLC